MGCSSTGSEGGDPMESNSKEFDYCFRRDEISFIKKAKKEREEGIKNEEEGGEGGREEEEEVERAEIKKDAIFNIYKKIELDFSKKEKILKEYLVLYIPEEYTKDTITYVFLPAYHSISSVIEKLSNENKYLKYAKINNDSKAITKFESVRDPEIENRYQCSIEFKITEKDKQTKLVTIEFGYKIKLIDEHGLIYMCFFPTYEENVTETFTVSFTLDDNYFPCYLFKDYFDEISKYKLYAFNKGNVALTLRDKRIKLKIENELDKGLLSKFTRDEIAQINNSLNTMEIHHNFYNLIYQKVIHNIKDNKNYTTVYDIVFFPHDGLTQTNSSLFFEFDEPLIVKQFKINNIIVKKEKKKLDESFKEDDENEVFDGYYVSDKKHLGFYYCFKADFGLFEFDCESNDEVDYFRLNCNNLGDITDHLAYGSSYKYEIILNGNKINFMDEDFKYKIENDKIILKGIIDGSKDNFNKNIFTELAKKYNNERDLQSDEEEFILNLWAEMRLKQFVPEKMKLC